MIDGDLRKGNTYKRLNESVNVGLSDFICSNSPLEDCIYDTNWDLLHYIPSGVFQEESPVRQLCSVNMEKAMKQLQNEYDFIIIDVPSLNSSVDAQILAVKADATILVTAMKLSTMKSLEEAKKQIEKAGGNIIGVIENKVNMAEYKKYIKDYDYFKKKKYIRKTEQ